MDVQYMMLLNDRDFSVTANLINRSIHYLNNLNTWACAVAGIMTKAAPLMQPATKITAKSG
jgi:hypothetical protein